MELINNKDLVQHILRRAKLKPHIKSILDTIINDDNTTKHIALGVSKRILSEYNFIKKPTLIPVTKEQYELVLNALNAAGVKFGFCACIYYGYGDMAFLSSLSIKYNKLTFFNLCSVPKNKN